MRDWWRWPVSVFFLCVKVWMLIIIVARIKKLEPTKNLKSYFFPTGFMFSFNFHILLNFIWKCWTSFSLLLRKESLNRCIIGRWQYKVRYARFFHESIFVFCQWEEQRVMGCGLGKSKLQLSKRDKGVGIKEKLNCVARKFLLNLKASSYFLSALSFAVSISVPVKHHFYLAGCLEMFW